MRRRDVVHWTIVVSGLVAILIAACLLAGCVSIPGQPDQLKTPAQIQDDIRHFKVEIDEFTYRDILQAAKIANEPPVDQIGAACYPAQAAKIRARLDAQRAIPVIGVVSAFERVNKIVFVFSAPDDSLAIACDALVKRTLIKIIEIDAKLASLAASFGASGAGDLPSILNAAKKALALLHELGVSIP